MKQLLNLDELPKVEKEIMEFLLDEYYSLEDGAETTSEDSFVIHYRDQTSYIINNIERIIKYNKPRDNAHFSQKKLEDLIEFLKKNIIILQTLYTKNLLVNLLICKVFKMKQDFLLLLFVLFWA